MTNTVHLLVLILSNGELLKIAASIDGDIFNEEDMSFFRENDNLKTFLLLDTSNTILSIEEIDNVIT